MTRSLLSFAAGLALAAGYLFTASQAYAFNRTVQFCNHTRDKVKVAAVYDKTGSSESTSEGWFIVASCSCREVVSDSLRATEVFLFAAKAGSMTPLLSGRGPACVHPTQAFNFVAQNRSAAACNAAGGQFVNFRIHDTGGNTNSSFTLTQPNACNL
jgi:uncharacterized membrane protein